MLFILRNLKLYNVLSAVRTLLTINILLLAVAFPSLPYLFTKNPPLKSSDTWSYITHVYPDAEAWSYINEVSSPHDVIATYDIRTYYLEPKVVALDSVELADLYRCNSVDKAIDVLRSRNIKYILSTSSSKFPSYYKNPITAYLGDSRYFPLVYVASSGASVYRVGPIPSSALCKSVGDTILLPRDREVLLNITVFPFEKRVFRIGIPCDYEGYRLRLVINSSSPVSIIGMWESGEYSFLSRENVQLFVNLTDYGYFRLIIYSRYYAFVNILMEINP